MSRHARGTLCQSRVSARRREFVTHLCTPSTVGGGGVYHAVPGPTGPVPRCFEKRLHTHFTPTIGTVPDALEEGRRASRRSGSRERFDRRGYRPLALRYPPVMRRTLLVLITVLCAVAPASAATPRSAGGTAVAAGAHPSVVLVEGTDIFGEVEFCTGVLIQKRVVVTSVTCVFFIDLDAAQVIVGRTSRAADNGTAIDDRRLRRAGDARPRPARARRPDQDPARRRRARRAGAAGRRRHRSRPARPARWSAGAP